MTGSNHKQRWWIFTASAAFTIMMGLTGYLISLVQQNIDTIQEHRLEWVHPGAATMNALAETNRDVAKLEGEQRLLIKQLERIETKLDRILENR